MGDGVQRLVAAAREAGVELLVGQEEAARNGLPAHGDPADAELVVVGLQRRSPVGKALLGSNAQRIILGASCAVLAVRASEDD